MAYNYTRLQNTASKLIAKFGKTQGGTVRRRTTSGAGYDPVETITDYDCSLVEIDIKIGKIDGTIIEATDRMVYVSTDGLTITINESDQIGFGGNFYEIKRVKPMQPGDTLLMYEILLKG